VTIYADMRAAYPATIRNDRLRRKVKGQLKHGLDGKAWATLKTASEQRQLAIETKIAAHSRSVRLEFFDWKATQQAQLTATYRQAYFELSEDLLRVKPTSWHAYAHRGHLLKNLEELRRQEWDFLRNSVAEATDIGQRSLYMPMFEVGASRTVGAMGPSTPFWGMVNTRAVKAIYANPAGSVPLSRRIWRHKNNAIEGIRRNIAVGIAQGKSVNQIIPTLRQFITEPLRSGTAYDKLRTQGAAFYAKRKDELAKAIEYRREARIASLAGKPGHVRTLTARAVAADRRAASLAADARKAFARANAAEAIPSKGLYRTWNANAWRMVREETNRAYREGFLQAARQHGNLVLHKWTLSAAHPVPDICDDYANVDHGHGAGVYKVENYPLLPHIGCLCYDTPVPQWDKIYKGSQEAA